MFRRWFQFGLVLVVMISTLAAGDVIERIVATINKQAILQSDWDEAVRYEAFVNRRRLQQVTAADRKAALDHLIDQELLRQQLQQQIDTEPASPDEISKQVQDIREQYSAAKDEAAWQADLRRYGLTPRDLERHIALQLSLEHMIDSRLRPSIHISRSNIETYYREQLLPELRKTGVKDVPLVEVSPKIEELLTQRRMNELLSAWLHDLRSQSNIRMGAGGQGISEQ